MKNKQQKPKGIVIEIYPACEKPSWMKPGALCNCWGEGNDIFRVAVVEERSAILETFNFQTSKRVRCHGRESFTKLHQSHIDISD